MSTNLSLLNRLVLDRWLKLKQLHCKKPVLYYQNYL